MATPTPRPQPTPGGTAGKVSGALGGLVVAPKGGGGKDIYGLGDTRGTAIVPGGMFPVQTDRNGTATAEQVMEAFLHAPPGVVATIQQKLYQSGAYSGTYNPMLHPGLIRPEDVAAFAGTLKVVAQQSTNAPMDLGQYLDSSASFGAATGKAAASANFETATHVVTHQDPNYMNLTADSVAQQVLGRKATAGERARFAALFDKTDVGRQMKQYAAGDATHGSYVQRELDSAGGATDQPPSVPTPRSAPTPGGPADFRAAEQGTGMISAEPSVEQFMQAIGGQESRGNYNDVNSDTGAAGKFQIMPGNWPSWSREAGLGPDAPRTPANQDRVARFKMEQYHQQFGSWDAVAVAWYAGPAAAKEWQRNPNQSRFTRPQTSGSHSYPSIANYVSEVTARLGSHGVLAPLPASTTDTTYAVDQPNIPISQRVDVTDTNPPADAEAFFRKEHPVEAGGKDVANTFDAFTKIIEGR